MSQSSRSVMRKPCAVPQGAAHINPTAFRGRRTIGPVRFTGPFLAARDVRGNGAFGSLSRGSELRRCYVWT